MERWREPHQGARVCRWWIRLWGGLAVLGAVLSPLVLGFAPAAASWLAAFGLGIVVCGILTPLGAPSGWLRAVRSAALWGAAFTALTAAVQVLGPGAMWILVVAALTSQVALTAFRRRLARVPVQAAPGAASSRSAHDDLGPSSFPWAEGSGPAVARFIPVDTGPEAISAVDTMRLCRLWRSSFLGLEAARSSAERLEVVRVRQALLDELHVRHLPEMRAWITAGGRAASGPERYLGHSARRSSP